MSVGLDVVRNVAQEFSGAAIQSVYRAAVETPNVDYRNIMLGTLLAHSKPLYDMHCDLLEWRGQTVSHEESAFASRAQTLGLLVTLDILMQAAPFDISHIDPRRAKDFQEQVIADPGSLDEEFFYAYVEHVPVIDFVDNTLKNEYSKFGSKILFGYFGDEAKPNKPAAVLPRSPAHVDDGVAVFLRHKPVRRTGVLALSRHNGRPRRY